MATRATRLKVRWAESAEELEALYKAEKQVERRTRLLALWHLRQGKRLEDVVEMLRVSYRTLQSWVNWYRCGALAEVSRRVRGHGSSGEHRAFLTALEQRALCAKVKLGEFRTVWDAVAWVEGRWGVRYTYKGLYDLLSRHDCKPKVPRPVSVKANPVLQEQWKKGGLTEKLAASEVSRSQETLHADEMRFGLWGQVRRRWGVKGVKIVQKIQIEYAWEYLVLGVDVLSNTLKWQWAKRLNQGSLLPIFQDWQPDAVVWDGASAHRGQKMGQLGFVRITLPGYSPELNPPERVFEYLRGKIEGIVYHSLNEKRQAITSILRKLNADKEQLRSLIGWQWIIDSFQQLPDT